MKGLELCERFFHEVGRPALERGCGDLVERLAIGLVGDGSECLGYDDQFSRDHDWGPGFCVWMTMVDFAAAGEKIQAIYEGLPRSFDGHERLTSQWGHGRVGVLEINAFYQRFIGKTIPPAQWHDWLVIPDNALATATNGAVFVDPLGEFTRVREQLLAYYPEDVRLKKIAARCMSAGQAGQYNYKRCLQRGESHAALHSLTKFCLDAMSIVFLLNRQYAPFYKWLHRALRELPVLGPDADASIRTLVEEIEPTSKVDMIEAIAKDLIAELRNQGLTDSSSDYLPDHGPEIQRGIVDPDLRAIDVWIG